MDASSGTARTTPNRRLNVLVVLTAAAFVGIFLAYKWQARFPYSGTWIKSGGGSGGQIKSIHFSALGACTLDVTGPDGSLAKQVACEYRVVDDKATIQYVLNPPDTNDRTNKPRTWFKGQLTPEQNGKTLSLVSLDGAVFQVEEGNISGKQRQEMGQKPAVFTKAG